MSKLGSPVNGAGSSIIPSMIFGMRGGLAEEDEAEADEDEEAPLKCCW